MKMRVLFAAGAMGLLLAFGAVAGACKNGGGGGGGALTLEEYFQQLSGLFEEALPQVEDATTIDEAFAPFATDEFLSIADSLDGTCAALQGVADDNNIDVDLGCTS